MSTLVRLPFTIHYIPTYDAYEMPEKKRREKVNDNDENSSIYTHNTVICVFGARRARAYKIN